MTGKKKFSWIEDMDESFRKIKAILAMDALAAYPDHNKRSKSTLRHLIIRWARYSCRKATL
jgi:hypothetical protein